jgi:murein DD-endopeptidase MepM/ murein hydrolase activator NlpD
MTPRPHIKYLVASALFGFVLGAFVVATLGSPSALQRARAEAPVRAVPHDAARALDDAGSPIVEGGSVPTTGRGGDPTMPADAGSLKNRGLVMPVKDVPTSALVESFHEKRDGTRQHEAIDILAPRNTPVVAVEDGTIAKLFVSRAGGNTIYQFDPTGQYAYYYAHLERYADGIKEGDKVQRGQVIGYVGTSGNAPKDTPHLHFAVFRLTADRHWWEGTPINPYEILR